MDFKIHTQFALEKDLKIIHAQAHMHLHSCLRITYELDFVNIPPEFGLCFEEKSNVKWPRAVHGLYIIIIVHITYTDLFCNGCLMKLFAFVFLL